MQKIIALMLVLTLGLTGCDLFFLEEEFDCARAVKMAQAAGSYHPDGPFEISIDREDPGVAVIRGSLVGAPAGEIVAFCVEWYQSFSAVGDENPNQYVLCRLDGLNFECYGPDTTIDGVYPWQWGNVIIIFGDGDGNNDLGSFIMAWGGIWGEACGPVNQLFEVVCGDPAPGTGFHFLGYPGVTIFFP